MIPDMYDDHGIYEDDAERIRPLEWVGLIGAVLIIFVTAIAFGGIIAYIKFGSG